MKKLRCLHSRMHGQAVYHFYKYKNHSVGVSGFVRRNKRFIELEIKGKSLNYDVG